MPETFGHYELLDLLGQGGMGVVWRARDTRRQRNVALKVLPEHLAEDAQFTARFRRESRLAAQLNEPHIIPIHDFGEIDGRLFIDMRLVEGLDLGTVLEQRQRLEPALAVEIVAQVASALDAAHADGLVHRDVKPSNVMLTGLTPDLRRTPFAYLVDFGIARSTQSEMTYATMTSAGTIGTIAYMSPERIGGDTGNARSDIYALACVLYETLTGVLPFEGEAFALLYKHVHEPAPRARDRVADLPPALDAVIARGMAKDPQERYAEAGEFALAAADALRTARAAPDSGVRPNADTHGPTLNLRPTRPGQSATPSTPPSAVTQQPAARSFLPPPRETAQPATAQPPQPATVHRANPPTTPPPPVNLPQRPRDAAPPGGSPLPPGALAQTRPPARPRRRGLALVALFVVAALVVLTVVLLNRDGATPAAKDNSKSSSAQEGAVGDIEETARTDVRNGGVARIAMSAAVRNFNVYTTDGATDEAERATAALLPQPFHYDAAGVPSVDTDYFTSITQTSADPMTIDYKINPKAVWSNGTPLSHVDFADLAAAMSGNDGNFDAYPSRGWDRIASVRKGKTAQDVIVTFSTPFADWRRLFAPLVPASLTSSPDAFNTAWQDHPLVTAGPFRYDATHSGPPYVEPRSGKWWGDQAKLDQLQFDIYDNQQDTIDALKAKKTNVAVLGGINAVANVAAARNIGGVSVRQYNAGGTYRLLTFNTADPLLSDIAVRRAIVHATDRATMTANLIGQLDGSAKPLQHYFALQETPGYTATCGTYCSYDVDAAGSTLKADGWNLDGAYYSKDGQPLEVSLLVPNGAANAASEATVLRGSLEAAGIRLNVKKVSSGELGQRLREGNFQLTVATRIGGPFQVSDDVPFYHYDPNDTSSNYGAGGSTKINDLLSKALSATTSAAERKATDALSRAMWSNASWLPLYERPQITGVTSTLVNIGAPGLADVRYQDVGYHK